MTDLLVQYIQLAADHAKVWGPLLVFLFMTVESSFIPFPSEVVMIPAGFLAARGALTLGQPGGDMVIAIAAGLLGSLAGAYVNYFLARKLGKPFLERYGRYFFLKPAALHRAEEVFREYGAGATFVCRLIPAIRQLISIPAGIAGMRLRTFTLCTGAGAGLWVTVLAFIGYSIGTGTVEMSYAEIVGAGKVMIKTNLVFILLGCAFFFAGYVWVHRRVMRSRTAAPTDAAPSS